MRRSFRGSPLYSAVFIPLERLFALRASQHVFRRQWTVDLTYFFINSLLIEILTILTLKPAMVLFDWAVVPGAQQEVLVREPGGSGERGGRGRRKAGISRKSCYWRAPRAGRPPEPAGGAVPHRPARQCRVVSGGHAESLRRSRVQGRTCGAPAGAGRIRFPD